MQGLGRVRSEPNLEASGICRNGRFSSCECTCNGRRQIGSDKHTLAGQRPDIEEVLHPTVQRSEADHRFELLRDQRLKIVGVEVSTGIVEERGVQNPDRPRCHDIAEANVDLHRNACVSEVSPELRTNTVVIRTLGNSLGLDARFIENKPIRDYRLQTDACNSRADGLEVICGAAEESMSRVGRLIGIGSASNVNAPFSMNRST